MPDQQDETLYRLTDIDTEEVSIVDAAANRRKFLVIKGANMNKAAGAPVVSDGKGGHTVSKDTPAAPPAPQAAPGAPAPAAPPAAPAGTPAPGAPAAEPVLTLAPEAKAELIKRFSAAVDRLTALKALVEGATETAGLVEIPAEIATRVAELLTGIAEGEVEKGAAVTKGLPQFSSARVSQIQAAHEALGALLTSIKPAEPATDPAPEGTPAPESAGDIAKAITAALLPLEEKLAKGLAGITAVVAQHSEAISKQATRVEAVEKSGRPTPRSGAPEGARETVGKDDGGEYEGDGPWPTDMADPDKHDVSKVDPSVRFTSASR